MKRIGHWSKNPKGGLFDESHTLRTYWDEEKYCFRCGNCHTEVKEGTVCKCANKNKWKIISFKDNMQYVSF